MVHCKQLLRFSYLGNNTVYVNVYIINIIRTTKTNTNLAENFMHSSCWIYISFFRHNNYDENNNGKNNKIK